MPWRLIVFLIVLVLVAFFAGFNISPIKISVGFYEFKEVPLFLALIIAFILGALVMLPFKLMHLRKGKKGKKIKKEEELALEEASVPAEPEEGIADRKKKKKK